MWSDCAEQQDPPTEPDASAPSCLGDRSLGILAFVFSQANCGERGETTGSKIMFSLSSVIIF